jgi:hypothetical protein
MKPVASTITEINNLPGDEVKFGIGKGQEAWVMRSMADLYSNRELACVREYSTNAYDSNKEKAMRDGHDIKPIEVTLPTVFDPYFKVKDSGVGMSRHELAEIYTQFGDSTKRDSDDFNGMLGFGSKSAIAYTNTFTVTSIKDGYKNVGVVTRREDAMGGYLVTLKIVVDNVPTSEPSGVEIQIPVHNWREFEQKAKDYYRFWLPGTVLVNGREPEWAVGEKIDDNLFYYPHNQHGQNISYVVMGNVPYRIINSDALFPRGMNRISFVAYVPLGTVEFTPSREDLKYSEHTKANLRKIITDFVDKSVQTAKDEIAAATNHAEAYKAWSKWRKVIGAGQVDDLTFKGDKLVDTFQIAADRWDTQSYRYGTWGIKEWYLKDMENTIIISDFDINLAAAHKKKVKDWMDLPIGTKAQYVLFTAEKTINSPWIDPARVVQWERIKKEAPKPPKKPRAASVAWGRKAGSFDLITRKGRKNEQDVPQSKELFYVMVQEYNRERDLGQSLNEFDMDHEVVLVPANRKDKFLRFYPHAKPIMPHLQSLVNLDGPSMLNDDAKKYLSTEPREAQMIAAMDSNKIEDPEVKKMIELFKNKEETFLKEYNKNFRLANVLGMGNKFKRHTYEGYWQRKGTPLTSAYPLANAFDTYNRRDKSNKHVYFYMNALYRARKDGKSV